MVDSTVQLDVLEQAGLRIGIEAPLVAVGIAATVCYLEGSDLAAEMVRAGLARDCPRFSGGRYRAAEAQAAAAGETIGGSYRLPGYCRPR
jgi:hypothetical protein